MALLLVCSACQVTIATEVDARADGGGVIRAGVGLDREALAQVPDLAGQLQVDDLRRAGWRVVGPQRERDGLTWIRASHPFASPAGAHRAVAQLTGPGGPFRGFALTHGGSRFRSRVRFTGTVDLGTGLAGFADAELERRLGAANPGVDAATLKRRFGVDLERLLKVRVTARLPGRVRTWRPRVGAPPVRLDASSVSWDVRALGLTGVGAVALALGAVTLLAGRRRRVTRHAPEAPEAGADGPRPVS
ncbi:MAG: hypothetical protein E6G06_11125 [Actinobacteria bacterium]|nr:MAG: hypothetical protein E6G06_11125 [Actinomycetota bacterium]